MASVTHDGATRRIVELTAEGRESSLLVLGERGIGKSRVLQHARERASGRTVLVRAHPGEAAFPLSGFAAIFDAIRDTHAADFGRHFTLRSTEPTDLFAAALDLVALLEGLDLEPTTALVDDVDLMDHASQALIGAMSDRLTGTHVCIAATATAVATRSVLGHVPSVTLAPLDTDESVRLARSVAPDGEESSLRILVGYTAGNPRLVEELISASEPRQLGGTTWLHLPPPATPTLAILAEPVAAGLDPEAREVMDAASLAAVNHAGALGEFCDGAADVVDDLLDASLLWSFGAYVGVADPRLRTFLRQAQTARARRERHRRMADVSEPHDHGIAAWHASFEAVSHTSVDDLLEAAAGMVRRGLSDAAVELVERALARGASLPRHGTAMSRLCWQLLRSGEIVLATRYSARAQADPSVPKTSMQLEIVLTTSQVLTSATMVDEDLQATADLHAAVDGDGVGQLLALGAVYHAERWEVDEARRLFERTAPVRESVSAATRSRFETVTEMLDALDGVPLAHDLPGLGEPRTDGPDLRDEAPDLLVMRGRTLTFREQYGDARRHFATILRHPLEQDRLWIDVATYGSIRNEIAAGEFRLARRAADEWGTESPWIDRRTASHWLIRAWYAFSAGAVEEARELVATCLRHASREASDAYRARALALSGAISLLVDDFDAAVNDLRQVSAMSARFRNPTLLRHWADYVEACVMTDRGQEATAAVNALERRLAAHHSRWGELARARCHALVDKGDQSGELFAAAVKDFGQDELPYELGRTLSSWAGRQEALGSVNGARRTRVSAVQVFRMCGADAWAARIEGVDDPDGSVLDRLSDDERMVVRHVVNGLRNSDIAAALHVSVRTVELRLTHVYRRLGISSRSQLAGLVGQDRPPSDLS